MPSLISFVLKKELQVEMLQIGTSDDYSGIEGMEPFQHNGKPLFLSSTKEDIKAFQRGVPHASDNTSGPVQDVVDIDTKKVIIAGHSPFLSDEEDDERFANCSTIECIPFTNSQVLEFYHAAANSSGNGVLLLDITNPRVNVPQNIFGEKKRLFDVTYCHSALISFLSIM
jgi:hypothetical protein